MGARLELSEVEAACVDRSGLFSIVGVDTEEAVGTVLSVLLLFLFKTSWKRRDRSSVAV